MSTTNEGKTWRQVTQVPGTLGVGSGVGAPGWQELSQIAKGIAVRSVHARGGPGRQSGPMTTSDSSNLCTPTVITVLGTA